MKLLIHLTLLAALVAACSDDEPTPQPVTEPSPTYSGTVTEWLADAAAHPSQGFDSLLTAIGGIPGMSDTLTLPGQQYTIFAASDASFASAEAALALYRRANDLGGALSLSDMQREPFTVLDTIITPTAIVSVFDTTYVARHYDYRRDLRSLLGRYIFTRAISSTEATDISYASLYARQMNILQVSEDAGGYAEAGPLRLRLVETRGSKQQTLWVKADVVEADIRCSNGYVHVLSPLHEFGFNDFTSLFYNYGNEKKK